MARENGYVQHRRKKALDAAKVFMGRVTDYVYREGLEAPSQDARDVVTLTLRLLEAVRHAEPKPWEAACFRAFGSSLPAYQKHRNQVKWRQYHEFIDALPKPSANPVAPALVPWPDTGTAGRKIGSAAVEHLEVGNRKSANRADAVSAG